MDSKPAKPKLKYVKKEESNKVKYMEKKEKV